MGLLILERKELVSKYEQVKTMVESSELVHNRDLSTNKSALAESRKREESLKKTIGVKDACIGSVSFLICKTIYIFSIFSIPIFSFFLSQNEIVVSFIAF